MTRIGGVAPQPVSQSSTSAAGDVDGAEGPQGPAAPLLAQLQEVKSKLGDVRGLRGALAQLRTRLADDLQLLRMQGHALPRAQREALVDRIEWAMGSVRNIEKQLLERDPQVKAAMGRLQIERDRVQEQTSAAYRSLNKLLAETLPDPARIASQMAVVKALLQKEGEVQVAMDRALGMPGPIEVARQQLGELRSEVAKAARLLANEAARITPKDRAAREAQLAHLLKKAAALEDIVVAGDPAAREQLQAARQERDALLAAAARQHAVIDGMLRDGIEPKKIPRHEREALAALEARIAVVAARIDTIVGLAPAA